MLEKSPPQLPDGVRKKIVEYANEVGRLVTGESGNSYNTGTIYAPGAWVGGLLGQAGAQTGDCTPLLQSCFSAAPLTGAASKTYGLYAKGTLSEKYLQDSYGLEQEGVLFHSGARPADLPTLSEHFQLELSIAPNFLLTESQKY